MIDTADCIEWDGARIGLYGIRRIAGKNRYVHRLAYEEVHGPIPAGMVIDHLCGNPPCFLVDHLEAVTPLENVQRGGNANRNKTHCPRGHPYSDKLTKDRRRECRVCRAAQQRERRRRL